MGRNRIGNRGWMALRPCAEVEVQGWDKVPLLAHFTSRRSEHRKNCAPTAEDAPGPALQISVSGFAMPGLQARARSGGAVLFRMRSLLQREENDVLAFSAALCCVHL